jgi:general secretion pathway protein I
MSLSTGSPGAWRSARRRLRRRRAAGLTLIELLVAFAIAALALGALLQLFSSGLGSLRRVERRTEATLLARSLLDEVGADIPLTPGERSGTSATGFAWRLRIVPSGAVSPAAGSDRPLLLYEVSVSVGGEREPALTLTTLRLAAGGAGGPAQEGPAQEDAPP